MSCRLLRAILMLPARINPNISKAHEQKIFPMWNDLKAIIETEPYKEKKDGIVVIIFKPLTSVLSIHLIIFIRQTQNAKLNFCHQILEIAGQRLITV